MNPLTRRAAINPYLIAARQAWRRLRWDLLPQSWRSRSRLRALRDSHAGQRAVILCNGPSLNRVDFDLLGRTYCFGLNKIDLIFPHTDFRPSSIVAVNPLVLQQSAGFYNQTDIPLFLSNVAVSIIRPGANRIFLDLPPMEDRFARDCGMSVFMGATVTYVALQLAFHMGFAKVALVGCDHHFETRGPANTVVETGGHDPNHFDPAYFANLPWQLPDLLKSELSYRMAAEVYAAAGRLLVNATDGGRLEVLPRMALADFLALP